MKIREATKADIPTLRYFENLLIEIERQWDRDIKQQDQVHYYDMEKLMKKKTTKFLIAEINNKPAACAFVEIKKEESWSTKEKSGYLGLVVVEKAYRKRGIGKQLIVQLQEWCNSRGVEDLKLDVYSKNTAARVAYKKLGFEECYVNMKLPKNPKNND